jgi:hypothetical protein
MSLFNSILPSRVRLSGVASQHELPMYHSPPQSPTPTSFPPAPVAASMYSSSPSRGLSTVYERRVPTTAKSEDLILLQRREKQLELELQELLDAQSDALLSGATSGSGPSEDDVMSINSGTPRIRSPMRSPVRPPAKREQITPAMARRGIFKSMRELASVKAHEENISRREMRDHQAIQRHLEGWNKKRASLRKEIDTIQHQDIRLRTQALQDEADRLQDEITQTEQKLAHMRRRHQALVGEISEIDNSVQSKLTSYVTSLNMLEDDIQKYLAKPPFKPMGSGKRERSFLSLPASRRTLEMAREYIASQSEQLENHAVAVRQERRALDHGSNLWKSCISTIENFERHLRKEMNMLSSSNSTTSMTDLLVSMNEVIASVETDLATATSNNWRLLEACVGAELEAFKQGRSILERAAGIVREQDQDELDKEDLIEQELAHEEMENQPETVWNTPRASRILVPLDDDEDDGPDPELMISRQDSTDTD